MKTALQNNIPLTGQIDLDQGYYRKTPNYDSDSFTYSMRQLRDIGRDYLQETVADFLKVLEMRSCHEIARAKGQEGLELTKLEEDVE